MKKLWLPIVALFATGFFNSTAWAQPDPTAHELNSFGFKLLVETRKAHPGNLFLSPIGVELAMAMAENGAGGETKSEMRAALHPDSTGDWNAAMQEFIGHLATLNDKVKLEVANSLWVQDGWPVKPAFATAEENYFQAGVSNLDFSKPAAAEAINSWVNDKTHGAIPQMATAPLDPALRLILLDAIYFKGSWMSPFKKEQTQDQPFTLPNAPVTLPFMKQTAGFKYLETADFQAIQLPYSGGQIGMFIFLPKGSLELFLQNLTLERWNDWLAQFNFQQGTLEMPRIKMDASYTLNSELESLGISRAFTRQADFSGISDEPLQISLVLQKTHLSVDETGTEAAAATLVGIRATAVARPLAPAFTMIVNQPFYLAICDLQSGAILFHGAIYNPKEISSASQ